MMNIDKFFPPKPDVKPTIYAYELVDVPSHKGLLKVGYTVRTAQGRVGEQLKTSRLAYRIVLEESAMRKDGTAFTDFEVHQHLKKKGAKNTDGEWFKCSVSDVRSSVEAVRSGQTDLGGRSLTFNMRPEQLEAVEKAAAYFKNFREENHKGVPHFLWNAKMRFGKTFAAYQLAKRLGSKKILVLTFKPAVHNAWEEDLRTHVDFVDWQFVSRREGTLDHDSLDQSKPFVCFGSFQDFLGKNSVGGIKAKNEWVHRTKWDLVVFDEYHYGAWRESAKDLFAGEEKKEVAFEQGEGIEYFSENLMPISTDAYLYLSGTPFRAISSGEFIEEQIYNWTYSDEQRAKEAWVGESNPYASLPRMVMMTYQLPDAISEVAMQGEFSEFDLNLFFSAYGEGEDATLKYEDEVQKWLDMMRGGLQETTVDNLKMGAKKPPMPFSHAPLLHTLSHTLWFLPSVAACHAMKNLLDQRQNSFYRDYEVIVAAGPGAGIGVDALYPVQNAMDDPDPLKTKTITLSCGKLTTGVSVKPWTGIFMLRSTSSPETYFQAAFRVQTPWVIRNPDDKSPNKEEIVKNECYVFDFAPNRALRQIADYSDRLNVGETNPERKVAEFIHFLPILAYDGSSMKRLDAAGVLDIAMTGTAATMLARRWESALLVNADNATLHRLLNSPEAMEALMSIEGFRRLNQDIETIINKSEEVDKAKKEANERDLDKKEKKQLTESEKEYKSLRKQIQEKLIKFATRIPVFMYLTDNREKTLKDVITQLEPELFEKVTGLSIKDFELLLSLGVFNGPLMNDAVYKFKRYEDSSLKYVGIDKHEGEDIGLFDTVVKAEEIGLIEGTQPGRP